MGSTQLGKEAAVTMGLLKDLPDASETLSAKHHPHTRLHLEPPSLKGRSRSKDKPEEAKKFPGEDGIVGTGRSNNERFKTESSSQAQQFIH